jgi:hypothetical protein
VANLVASNQHHLLFNVYSGRQPKDGGNRIAAVKWK